MKTAQRIGCAIIFLLFTAFKPSEACEYVGSNINFVKSQTEKAISQEDLNLIRYHAYKALNAIEKSQKQLKDCGCNYAALGIEESSYLLKRATKSTTVERSRSLLNKALENTVGSLEALYKHELHVGKQDEAVLAMHTTGVETDRLGTTDRGTRFLQNRIDRSLKNYSASLNKVVSTVNCKEAKAFAQRIYNHCEQELLNPDLSEGKKYYNLRTKEITWEALQRIGECPR